MRRVEQRYSPMLGVGAKRIDIRIMVKLGAITPFKLFEALWLVSEPFAQLRRRRHVLRPMVECRCVLFDSPWPKPVDKNPCAILWSRWIINALGFDLWCHRSAAHVCRQWLRAYYIIYSWADPKR